MDKVEYFKYGLKQKYYKYKSWILGCFSIVTDDIMIPKKEVSTISLDDESENDNQPLIKTNGTFKVALVNGEYVKLDDVTTDKPMFTFHSNIKMLPGDLPNIKEEMITTYGRVLVNAVLLSENFGDKIDFINNAVKVSDIESQITKRLTDNVPLAERDPNNKEKIYVDEYLRFTDSCIYITGISQLCVYAATERTLTPPPGLEEFKAKLLKKYEGKLHDPLYLIAFENELREFDKEYISKDPTWGIFMNGNIFNNVRKKLFLCLGTEGATFNNKETDLKPVLESLHDGWPRDNSQFTDLLNVMRQGFYARGKETVKGGVIAKSVMRTTNNFMILDEDCGTEKGIKVKLTSFNIKTKVGRYMRLNNKWVRVDNIDMLKPYLGKEIVFRSPMFCRCQGDRICKYCSGVNLALNPRSLTTALTDLSSVILNSDMKKMHGSVLSMAKLVLNDLIT